MNSHALGIGAERFLSKTFSVSHIPERLKRSRIEQELWDLSVPWAIPSTLRRTDDQLFEMKRQSSSFFDMISLRCNDLRGGRRQEEISATGTEFVAIMHVREGYEHLKIGRNQVTVHENQMILWDSSYAMEFDVPEYLDRVTLVVPKIQIKNHIHNFEQCVGRVIDSTQGLGQLLANNICFLDGNLNQIPHDYLHRVIGATLDLADASFNQDVREITPKHKLISRINKFIDENIRNASLSPNMIASSLGISLRYLHKIYEDEETSVSETIKRKRLARCRQSLSLPSLRHQSITYIAYEWGFSDSSYFARVFKQEFGISPSEYRRQCDPHAFAQES